MVITLYRPSPQVPKPTGKAALRCYESAVYIINLSAQQVRKAAIDITWVFLLTLYMSLNTLLWSLTYSEVRAACPRENVEELVNMALDIIDQCSERWPGTEAASQLYAVFAKACMRGYESKEESSSPSATPVSGPASGSASTTPRQPLQHAPPTFTPPQFGYVFDSSAQDMNTGFNFGNDSPFDNPPPSFRSNSIFLDPGSGDESKGRRSSYFPPDFTQPTQTSLSDLSEEPTPPATTKPFNLQSSPPMQSAFSSQTSPPVANPLLTPPESLAHTAPNPSTKDVSPTLTISSVRTASPTPPTHHSPAPNAAQIKQERGGGTGGRPGRSQAFTIPPPPSHSGMRHQRPLPPATTVTDWFSPPPPFISPYAFTNGSSFSGTAGSYWADPAASSALGIAMNGGGGGGGGGYDTSSGVAGYFAGGGMMTSGPAPHFAFPDRHGSLSQEQQMELMDVLETEGMGVMDAFLHAPMGLSQSQSVMEGIHWA